jgi:hypothetical protein
MKRGLLPVLGASVLLAGCTTYIGGVRLEGVRPLAAVEVPERRPGETNRQSFGGVVAVLSSRRDLRQAIGLRAHIFDVYIDHCRGRTHLADSSLDQPSMAAIKPFDAWGYLDRPAPAAAFAVPTHLAGVATPPGRFPFMLQVSAWRITNAPGRWDSRPTADELLSGHDDLCAVGRGARMFGRIWRTNTVVIPYALIRDALLAAAPQPDPAILPLPTPPAGPSRR